MRCSLFEADMDKWLRVNFGIKGEWDDLPPVFPERPKKQGSKK